MTTVNLDQIGMVIETMLSPLAAPSIDAWARRVARAMRTTCGGSQALVVLPTDAHNPILVGDESHPLLLEWLAARMRLARTPHSAEGEDWATGDDGFDSGWHERPRLADGSSDSLWTSDEIERATQLPFRQSAFYHEIWVPTEVEWAVGLSTRHHAELATAFADRRHGRFGDDPTSVLRILLPAWRSGVEVALRLDAWRSGIPRAVDALGIAVAIFDQEGRLVHRTSAFASMAEADDAHALLNEAANLAAAVRGVGVRSARKSSPAVQAVTRVASVRERHVRLRATILPSGFVPGRAGEAVAVVADWLSAAALTVGDITHVTSLSRREAEVASLIATGADNAAVARALGCSPHTARHHTERVLTKLGVHSRRNVRAALERMLAAVSDRQTSVTATGDRDRSPPNASNR